MKLLGPLSLARKLSALPGRLRRWRHAKLLVAILIAHLVCLGILGLRAGGWLEPLELLAYDILLSRQAASLPPDQRIVVVWYTDEDQRRWGYPLPDQELLRVFETLLASRPASIGLDLYRDMPVPQTNSPAYPRLEALFRDEPRIVGIQKFEDKQGTYVAPPPGLKGTDRIGFNDLLLDNGNLIRRGLLFLDDGENIYEYFGLILVRHYLRQFGLQLRNDDAGNLVLGKQALAPPLPVPMDFGGYVSGEGGGYQFLSMYPGAPDEFPGVTIGQVLDGQFDPALFTGKIVLIGSRAEATPDFFYTPVSRWSETDPRVPGAAVHAYNISQLLRLGLGELPYPYPKSWEPGQEALWIWLWTLLGGLVCLWARNLWRFSLVTLGGLALLAGVVYTAFMHGWWLLAAAPALGWFIALALVVTYFSYQERSDRTVLMQLFSKHVSKDVAEVIWQSRDQYLNEGRLVSQRLNATVLFSDLQNFTTVSENMEPQALMEWLNEYMGCMVRVVEAHHGQVNKFIGDAVMAIFGVPVPRNREEEIVQDAINAVECALAMREEITHLREKWAAEGMPLIRMRVGIFTGPLVAGSLGGTDRQEYTVIGDTVNTASRLESFDKTIDAATPCRILIGAPTLECLGGRFATEQVGEVRLKGKMASVTIYRVLGRKEAQPGTPLVGESGNSVGQSTSGEATRGEEVYNLLKD